MQKQGLKILLVAFVLMLLALSNAQMQSGDDQELPDYIAPCYRDDPMLSECVKDTFHGIIRKLADGKSTRIPEINVPPIEPLYKDEIDAFDVAGMSLKFKNISVHGVSKLKIVWNSASTKTKVYDFHGYADPLEIFADYELSGFFFFLPIRAAGTINVTGRHIQFKADCIVDIVSKHGVDFVEINNARIKTYITDGFGWVSNLGRFEVAINRVLNNRLNTRLIMDHVTPIMDENVGYILQKFSNRIFKNVPYDKLLLKRSGPVPETYVEPNIDDDQFIENGKKKFFDKIMSYLY